MNAKRLLIYSLILTGMFVIFLRPSSPYHYERIYWNTKMAKSQGSTDFYNDYSQWMKSKDYKRQLKKSHNELRKRGIDPASLSKSTIGTVPNYNDTPQQIQHISEFKSAAPFKDGLTESTYIPPSNLPSIQIAIIPGQNQRNVYEPVIDLLEVQLSQLDNLVLLERTQIWNAIDELSLSAGGFIDPKQSAKLGNLLSADVLLIVEKVPTSEPPMIRLRFVESTTAITLNTVLLEQAHVKKNLDWIVEAIVQTNQTLKTPAPQRHHIAFLDFKSEEPTVALDGHIEALKMFLTADLSKSSQVIVLDREHLRYLNEELRLTQMDQQLKSSLLLLDGSLKYTQGQTELAVSLNIHSMKDLSTKKIKFNIPTQNIQKARNILNKKILNAINVKTTDVKQISPVEEAKLFLKRVPLFLSSAEHDLAIQHAEVAFSLNPTQKARYWLARSWYEMGWTLADGFGGMTAGLSSSFHPGNTKAVTVVQIKSKTDNTLPSKNKINVNRSFWGDTSTILKKASSRPHTSYDNLEKKKRTVSAFLRSYTLYYELAREHARRVDTGLEVSLEIPNPIKYPNTSRYYHERGEWPLPVQIHDDEYHVKKLNDQFMNMRKQLLKFQEDFYKNHYKNLTNSKAYWQSWRDKKDLIMDSKPKDSSKIVPFLKNIITAFIETENDYHPARFKGLLYCTAIDNHHRLYPKLKKLFQAYTKSTNDFVRLVSFNHLIPYEKNASSIAQLQILTNSFPYSHPIWQLEDLSILPNLIRTATTHAALNHSPELIQTLQSVFAGMIRSNDANNLVAWRQHVWPYLNALEIAKKKAQLVQTLNKMIAVLEQNNYKNSSSDAKLLRGRLELKLVKLGVKKNFEPKYQAYLELDKSPYYLRMSPELEPPRLGEDVDYSTMFPDDGSDSFKNSVVRGHNNQGTAVFVAYNSPKSSQSHNTDGAISARSSAYTLVDEVYTTGSPNKSKSNESVSDYTLEKMPTRVGYQLGDAQSSLGRIETRSNFFFEKFFIHDNTFYTVDIHVQGQGLNLVNFYEYPLNYPDKIRKVGFIKVQSSPKKPLEVTAMATNDQFIFVGTNVGIIAVKKQTGTIIPSQHALKSGSNYQGYYLVTEPTTSANQAKILNTTTTFPFDNILSLASHKDLLYVGVGPLSKDQKFGLKGKSGLIALNTQNWDYEILASTTNLSADNALDAGRSYQIKSIAIDEQNDNLWLSIAGDVSRNGLWQYNFKSKVLTQRVKENLDVEKLIFSDGRITYYMPKSGISRYDPKTNVKTWLIGYKPSGYTGIEIPRPPNNLTGEPIMGHPQTRLIPMATDGNRLLTFQWTMANINIHDQIKKTFTQEVKDPSIKYGNGIVFMTNAKDGVWVIDTYGSVFLMKRRK